MTKFINKKTGVVMDFNGDFSGGDWEEVKTSQPEPDEIDENIEEIEEFDESEEIEDFDLTKMNVSELKAFAEENEIELPYDAKKTEIIELIAEAFI